MRITGASSGPSKPYKKLSLPMRVVPSIVLSLQTPTKSFHQSVFKGNEVTCLPAGPAFSFLLINRDCITRDIKFYLGFEGWGTHLGVGSVIDASSDRPGYGEKR